TLAGVIWSSFEKRVPPWSPPQYSQAAAGEAASTSKVTKPARQRMRTIRLSGKDFARRMSGNDLLRLLVRRRGPRPAPGVVFFLGLRNALERLLIGLLVDLRLFLIGFGSAVARPVPSAAHLRVRRQCQKHQQCRRHRQGSHRISPLPSQRELSAR